MDSPREKQRLVLAIIPPSPGPLRAQQGGPASPPKTSDPRQLESKGRAHAVTDDTGRAQNPLRFIPHIRVTARPSSGVGEE